MELVNVILNVLTDVEISKTEVSQDPRKRGRVWTSRNSSIDLRLRWPGERAGCWSLTTARRIGTSSTKLLDSIGISDVLDRESASDAFEILQQQRIGLVIADVEMLPISGLDLLKAIRANPRTSKFLCCS